MIRRFLQYIGILWLFDRNSDGPLFTMKFFSGMFQRIKYARNRITNPVLDFFGIADAEIGNVDQPEPGLTVFRPIRHSRKVNRDDHARRVLAGNAP